MPLDGPGNSLTVKQRKIVVCVYVCCGVSLLVECPQSERPTQVANKMVCSWVTCVDWQSLSDLRRYLSVSPVGVCYFSSFSDKNAAVAAGGSDRSVRQTETIVFLQFYC